MTDFGFRGLVFRNLGLADYERVWRQMQNFTNTRTEETADELWLVQHPPVFTLGQQGERNQILQRSDIPIIQTDRGGHVTYHGPGQIVAYPLLNLRRHKLGVRSLVTTIETILVELLKSYNIDAYPRLDAPGVYTDNKKIASIGLRIRKGCSYHGLALNVNMDLSPFSFINPCGMVGMEMVNMSEFIPDINIYDVMGKLTHIFEQQI
jgi:lipoyl(octanoyl) transferase